ncbi:S-layer protein [Thermococcus alcaliphilus]|uniref:S-layer protein n=1 Tax=Thermococcus alcaliphilus TaxID=139207 RepID=UPI0020911CD7|nr:S-layer protein [Thermococcus alcaliphilus]MCO6040613.1 S-layer protein [Thermococcus alcaliphilus]
MKKIVSGVMILALFMSVLFSVPSVSSAEASTLPTIQVSFNELTDTTFAFTIMVDSISGIEYKVIDESMRTVLSGNVDNKYIKLSNLEPGREYIVKLYKDNNPLLEIPFKTFNSLNSIEGFRLFYFIDLTDTVTGEVKVTIFGQFRNSGEIKLKRFTYYHTLDIGMNVIEGPNIEFYKGSGKTDVERIGSSIGSIYIYPSFEGYFRLEYTCDKSKRTADPIHGVLGHLSNRYFIASHEQFLIFPEMSIDEQQDWFALSAITPIGWKLNTWWNQSKMGILYVPKNKVKPASYHFFEQYAATHFYAYNPKYFVEYKKKVANTTILVIKETTIKDPWEDYIFRIYGKLVEHWGEDIDLRRYDYSNYVVMLVDDSDPIWAGEYTDAQGFSVFGDPFEFEMVAHQMFHRWNGWITGIGVDINYKEGESHKFWGEGFNEFYCDKVTTELGLTSPHWLMTEVYYPYYRKIYGTEKDGPLVYYDPKRQDSRFPYSKGAVAVYYLDMRLREITNNKHSIDDVLKYFLRNWKERDQPFSYERFIDYLEELGGKEFAEEARQIIYGTKEIVLDLPTPSLIPGYINTLIEKLARVVPDDSKYYNLLVSANSSYLRGMELLNNYKFKEADKEFEKSVKALDELYTLDLDNDGVKDVSELFLGLNTSSYDSNNDGIPDKYEVAKRFVIDGNGEEWDYHKMVEKLEITLGSSEYVKDVRLYQNNNYIYGKIELSKPVYDIERYNIVLRLDFDGNQDTFDDTVVFPLFTEFSFWKIKALYPSIHWRGKAGYGGPYYTWVDMRGYEVIHDNMIEFKIPIKTIREYYEYFSSYLHTAPDNVIPASLVFTKWANYSSIDRSKTTGIDFSLDLHKPSEWEVIRSAEIIYGAGRIDEEYSRELSKYIMNPKVKADSNGGQGKYLILVGGPLANQLTREYMTYFPVQVTNDFPGKGKGVIEAVVVDGKVVILLAGSDRLGTKAAVEVFKKLSYIPSKPIFVSWNEGHPKIIETEN